VSYEVRWGEAIARKAAARFGDERSARGAPSHFDFVCGPLAAAAERCRDFDSLAEEAGPSIRSVWIIDPVFGPVVFIAVLVDVDVVELADFTDDPDYWRLIQDDPEQP
jgi:hypothetical protein